jgi:hypothetical protein
MRIAMQIDLSKMPLLELKAFAYDQMAMQEVCLQNLRAANQEIERKTQERIAEIDAKNAALDAKHAELDARNAALDAKMAQRTAADDANGPAAEPGPGATGAS